MKVIYIDRLFWFEMLSDLTLLRAAGKLCRIHPSPLRLAASALFGAAYAVLCIFFPILDCLPIHAFVLILMLLLAYGRSRKLWRISLAFLFMCAVYSGVSMLFVRETGQTSIRSLLFSLGLSLGVCALPFRFTGSAGGIAEVRLCGGTTVCLDAFVDTGNFLKEPISGGSVILAGEETLLPLLAEKQQSALKKSAGLAPYERLLYLGSGFRLVPCRTLSGGSLLLAFRPKAVFVDGVRFRNVWVAMVPDSFSPGDGCNALIGQEFVKEA